MGKKIEITILTLRKKIISQNFDEKIIKIIIKMLTVAMIDSEHWKI